MERTEVMANYVVGLWFPGENTLSRPLHVAEQGRRISSLQKTVFVFFPVFIDQQVQCLRDIKAKNVIERFGT